MLSSPLVALLALVVAIAGAVVLAASLLDRGPSVRRWALSVTVVALVALGATLPLNLRDAALGRDGQRRANSELPEYAARERCLHDVGQPGLPAALQLARRLIPEGARYRLVTSAAVRACVALNMLPRRPVPPDGFDASRDWSMFHVAVPADARAEADRQQALPEPERTHHLHAPDFVVVEPAGAGAG